jgi:hypothetical protein
MSIPCAISKISRRRGTRLPRRDRIGDQRRDLLGPGRHLRLSEIGKFVEGVMGSRVGRGSSTASRVALRKPGLSKQVIGRVPVIERRSVGLIGHFGAHHG